MVIELRKKSQITLPKEIVKKLNLEVGDKFDNVDELIKNLKDKDWIYISSCWCFFFIDTMFFLWYN